MGGCVAEPAALPHCLRPGGVQHASSWSPRPIDLMKLSPALSSYLDFLRFFAALAVMLGHMREDGFHLGQIPLSHFSHEAVVIFFVMSGLIIHTSTVGKKGDWVDYAVARVSRVYSVALPAVIFSVALSLALELGWPALAKSMGGFREFSIADIVSALAMANEAWGTWRERPNQLTLNGPYWSLCYEASYYLLFGLFLFVRGRWRWPVLICAGLLVGPSVLLLFPIWLLGAWYSARRASLPVLPERWAVAVFAGAVGFVVALHVSGIDVAIKMSLGPTVPGFWRMEASQRFITDHLVAVAVVAHIHAAQSMPATFQRFFERQRRLFGAWAGFSFTLYLFHRPMSEFFGAVLPKESQTVLVGLAFAALVLMSCWAASFATERQLPLWRAGLGRLVVRLGWRPPPRPAAGAMNDARPLA